MIIKIVKNSITPSRDKATDKMSILTNTDEDPITIKFVSQQELIERIAILSDALAKGNDLITTAPNGYKFDMEEFNKELMGEPPEKVIEFNKPPTPKAKPMTKEKE